MVPRMRSPLLIDATRVLSRALLGRIPTGVDRVCLAYLDHFSAQARAVFLAGDVAWTAPASLAASYARATAHGDGLGRQRKLLSLLRGVRPGLGGHEGRGAIYLNVGHHGLDKRAAILRLRKRGMRMVFLVHDLIPITHPEFCRAGESERHRRRLRTALESAAGIITNSSDTAFQLRAFAEGSGIDLPPLITSPLAPALPVLPSTPAPMDAAYFAMVGTIEPRKNHWMILQVWKRLVEVQGRCAPRLVLIGQRGWECENVLDMLERCPPLQDMVIELNGLSDQMAAGWLRHARALLFPSFAEGFGLPLVEAMAMGTPVIASDLPAFRESAGDLPEYLDPLDASGWHRAIQDYALPGSERRKDQLSRIRHYRPKNWNHHFDIVESWLSQLS